jgi:hypothetical protein
MAAELIIAPEAEQDLAEAYAWYEGRRIGLGEEFLSGVDACKVFYEHPRSAGEAAKVALTACMRKLLTIRNAMVRHQTRWQPRELSSA